jgi:polar amino acid transport system permease protein
MANLKLRSEAVVKRTAMLRLADVVFAPLGVLAAVLALPARWQRRRARARAEAGLRLSPRRAMCVRCCRLAGRVATLLAKTSFLAFLAYLLYMIGQGLAGFDWTVIRDNLTTLLIWRFPYGGPTETLWGLGGLAMAILMSVIAISVSFVIGLVVGLGRMSENNIFRVPSTMYIELIRGNPLIMVIFWVYFFSPVLLNIHPEVFWSATAALTIFTGAYLAEIVRGGIQTIPRGQFEAAYSTGLTYWQTMRKIILPQALKLMIPAIVGQFISIFKDTSLAYVIGVLELTQVAKILNNRLMVHPFEIYTAVAALYFVGCYSMSILARRLERKLSRETVRLSM